MKFDKKANQRFSCFSKFLRLRKRAMMGESILKIYHILLIAFIAVIVLGLFAVAYDYYIDVRGAEAQILVKKTVNCLAPDGVLDLDDFKGYENKIFDLKRCKMQNMERFYVKVSVLDGETEIKSLQHGDSGLTWFKEFFKKTKYQASSDSPPPYKVNIINDGKKIQGYLNVEVLVSHEF